MELKNIQIDFGETFGELMLIGNPTNKFAYEEGKKTDKLDGISYPVISTRTWDKLSVSTKEQAPSIEYAGTPIPVTLIGAKAKLWQDFKTKEVRISVTADSISTITRNKLKMNKGVEE